MEINFSSSGCGQSKKRTKELSIFSLSLLPFSPCGQHKFKSKELSKKMSRKKFNRPAFFKLMVGNFMTYLRIPPEFVSCVYGGNVPEKFVLKPEIGKAVKVYTEKRGKYWFLSSGWSEFVMKQQLKNGDFVHFSMMGESTSTFEVFSLGKNCCPKHLKENYLKYQEEEDSIIEITDEEETAMEEAEPCRVATSRAKFQKKTGGPKIGAASFELVLKERQIYGFLVPQRFVKAAQLLSQTEVVVKDPNGRSRKVWPVKLRFSGAQVRFGSGWRRFLKDNMLTPGGKLRLELASGTRNVIKVQILKSASG